MPTKDEEEQVRKMAKKLKKKRREAAAAAAEAEEASTGKKKKKNRDSDDGGDVSASDRKVKRSDNEAGKGLKHFVDSYNGLKAQKDDISAEITVVMAEAKAAGYAPKAVKEAAKLSLDSELEKKKEFDDLVGSYLSMLGVKPR